jgi:Lipocalin-like domain
MTSGNHPLVGTWKLVSSTRTDVESGEESHTFGLHPTGFLNYSPDGRVMVVMVGDHRMPPGGPVPTDAEMIAWFKSTLAYAGRYTVEGNQVIHHVQASSDPLRAGATLVRSFRLDGRVLTLTAAPTRYWMDGRVGVLTIVWEKLEERGRR